MNPNLKKYLKEFDAILVSSWGNITYLTNYSGFSQTERECFLLITHSKQYLITDKRYSEALTRVAKDFEVLDTGVLHFITKDAKDFFEKEKIKTVGFEDYDLTVSEYSKLKKMARTRPVDLRNLRIIKRKDEIENIKKACAIGDETFAFILKELRVGISEREISDKLETFINLKGADFSFAPIVAFGKNSSVPHHLSGQTKLKKNQIVLLDFGVKVNNYCSDMTRTVFYGSADAQFKRMHEVVLQAQTKAIEFLKSSIINHKSISGKQIDAVARNYIIKQGYPNIIHSLGHGVGIEVHESPHLSPNSKDLIQSGMIFSVEPGIYLPNNGGVRIEDLVLVTKKGAELISHANREIIEI